MSAIFDFSSLVTVLLLLICTCTYLRELRPGIFDGPPPKVDTSDPNAAKVHSKVAAREGFWGFLWKLSRVGERLSPYVGAGCALMAVHILFFK